MEVMHKRYLNDWFTGAWPGSWSRGELYNDDPRLGDARLCGTTASLVGIESAESDPRALERAVRCDLMLHAWMLTQSGIPVLYSGDEVAQLNDYGYHDDPDREADSRYLHRGRFDWDKARGRSDPESPQGQVFSGLKQLTHIRAAQGVFHADAAVRTLDTGDISVLGVERAYGGEVLTALFNFSEHEKRVTVEAPGVDLVRGTEVPEGAYILPPYGFLWCKH